MAVAGVTRLLGFACRSLGREWSGVEWVRMRMPTGPRVRIKKDRVRGEGELVGWWLAAMRVQGGHANGPPFIREIQTGPKFMLEVSERTDKHIYTAVLGHNF